MAELKKINKRIASLLYQILHDVGRILEKNNIAYWVVSGTLLGAVRHGGIIPWDDDIDIGIDQRDGDKIMELKDVFERCGISVIQVYFGYKLFYNRIPNSPGQNYSYPALDIFTYKFVKEKNKLILSLRKARNEWPKDLFYSSELFPLKKYKFGLSFVWGPYEYKGYLTRMYGKKWNIEAYRDYDHYIESSVKKVKVILTDSDRVPAFPVHVKNRNCIQ